MGDEDDKILAMVEKIKVNTVGIETANKQLEKAKEDYHKASLNLQKAQKENADIVSRALQRVGYWNKDTPEVKALEDYKLDSVVKLTKQDLKTQKQIEGVIEIPASEYLQCRALGCALIKFNPGKNKGKPEYKELEALLSTMAFGQSTWMDKPTDKSTLQERSKYEAGMAKLRLIMSISNGDLSKEHIAPSGQSHSGSNLPNSGILNEDELAVLALLQEAPASNVPNNLISMLGPEFKVPSGVSLTDMVTKALQVPLRQKDPFTPGKPSGTIIT